MEKLRQVRANKVPTRSIEAIYLSGGPKFPVRLTAYTSNAKTFFVYEGRRDSSNDAISNTNGRKSV